MNSERTTNEDLFNRVIGRVNEVFPTYCLKVTEVLWEPVHNGWLVKGTTPHGTFEMTLRLKDKETP